MDDLRGFLEKVCREAPDQIMTISESVPVDFTATALAFMLEQQRHYPVLMFEKLQGTDFRLAANLFGSRELMARSLGIQPDVFNEHFSYCLDNLVPARRVADGPVQDIVWTDDEIDLRRLPVPLHFNEDAGPYITAGMVAARDPDTGVGNLAYARLQVKGPRRLGASLHSRQHLWDYFRRAQDAGQDLPVAVVIGAHPAIMLAAAAKMGIDQDEYDLVGALLGQALPLVRACTVDVDVPAQAEIVIEGHLLANTFEPEGPFGEYTGYATGRSTNNALEVTAITMRHNAIFVDIVPGNSSEHLTLGRAGKEAWVHKRMKEALPFFVDFHYPSSGTHFHAYVRIDKTAEGQAQQAAHLMVGLDHYLKLIVVVDRDIDPANEQEVLWAMATRMQADRDISITSHMMCNRLDPSSEDGVGAKMLVDATQPLGKALPRATLPPAAQAFARQLLRDASGGTGNLPPDYTKNPTNL